MRIVADTLKAPPLHLVCTQCHHDAQVPGNYLKERVSLYTPVSQVPFCCSQCGSKRVRIAQPGEQIDRPIMRQRKDGHVGDLFDRQ